MPRACLRCNCEESPEAPFVDGLCLECHRQTPQTRPPDSRVYVHLKCKRTTIVSGHDISVLPNPNAWRVTQTICPNCPIASIDYLSNFYWADSGEGLVAYRARVWKLVPLWVRALPYLGGLACVVIGWLVAKYNASAVAEMEAAFWGLGGLVSFWSLRWLLLPDFRKFK